MSHDHDDIQTEPIRGLPEMLPEGEFILWQGQPHWWALAKDSLNLWWVAGYFGAVFVWRAIAGTASMPLSESLAIASLFLIMGAVVCLI